MGSCTAGGAYVPAMSDEAIIVRNQGTIFLGGPPLVKAATGEIVTAEELGGGDMHSRVSGVTDHLADDDHHALQIVRSIVATLPPAGRAAVGSRATPRTRRRRRRSCMASSRPTLARRTTCARSSPASSTAAGSTSSRPSTAPRWSPGFARIHGHPVGIVANNGVLFSRVGAEGRALHRAVRPARDPAAVPAEHHRVHGRPRVRGRRHRQARRQDGQRRGQRPGAQAHRGHRRLVRRRQLQHVRPGVLAAVPVDVAERADLGDGRRAGRLGARHRAPRADRERGEDWPAADEEAFRRRSASSTSTRVIPYYSTARLWDDGIIDPADTRTVLGLALSSSAGAR